MMSEEPLPPFDTAQDRVDPPRVGARAGRTIQPDELTPDQLGQRRTRTPKKPAASASLSERQRLRAERQRLSEERISLQQELAAAKHRSFELEQQARDLVRQTERLAQQGLLLAREREELRSERMALVELRRRVVPPSAADQPLEQPAAPAAPAAPEARSKRRRRPSP
jgi:hypothetical protein